MLRRAHIALRLLPQFRTSRFLQRVTARFTQLPAHSMSRRLYNQPTKTTDNEKDRPFSDQWWSLRRLESKLALPQYSLDTEELKTFTMPSVAVSPEKEKKIVERYQELEQCYGPCALLESENGRRAFIEALIVPVFPRLKVEAFLEKLPELVSVISHGKVDWLFYDGCVALVLEAKKHSKIGRQTVQLFLEMQAASEHYPHRKIYGIISDGAKWQFFQFVSPKTFFRAQTIEIKDAADTINLQATAACLNAIAIQK